MAETIGERGRALECFRGYLRFLAQSNLDGRLRGKLDASDIVQQTMLEACRGLGDFRGSSQAQTAAWLRQILARNLSNAVRDLGRAKRDAGREVSLDAAVENSSARLESFLAAEGSSPSRRARRAEDVLRLAEAMAGLPDDQREALVLRHFRELPLADISRQMGRTPAAVAGLLHRGIEKLRAVLAGED